MEEREEFDSQQVKTLSPVGELVIDDTSPSPRINFLNS
jgi:hypothetical protein